MPILTGSELEYIDWIRRRSPAHPSVLVGPGDDAAALRLPADKSLLVTTDMLLEGSCFLLEEAGPHAVGRKAIAVNLSDIAAMAGIPTAAVVSIGLPKKGGRRIAEALYDGMREIADEFATPIVGGDTNSWNGPLVISVTLLGTATADGLICRNGAQLGDWIFVTGRLGGSILGRHLSFMPRIREAQALHAAVKLHSMIDVSDGLSSDLHHICDESRCGAMIDAGSLPIAPEAFQLAQKDGRSPLEHALHDGEDFELLFTVSAEDGRRLLSQPFLADVPVCRIGEIVPSGCWIVEDGKRRPLEARGYVHDIDAT